MVEFTWDQLLKRHITESLRILYKRFCTEEEMDAERMEAMRDVCYAYEVRTKVQNMNCVLVIEKDGQIRQRVPYDPKNGAVICLYDKESRIVWESIEGRHYTDSIAYETRRLFYEPRFLDMCRKYAASEGIWEREREKEELSFENIREKGLELFDERDVFRLCSRRIREDNYEEDEFLTYLCFELFKRQQYDKVTLMYLSNYFCGATRDMKALWHALQDYGIPAFKVGERIITQMVFSENLFEEEKIFEDYYLSGNVYFRLKQAYLAYAAREYVVRGRKLERSVFEIIANECDKKEDLPDICKIALLKFYSGQDYQTDVEQVLHAVLREMCEKQIVFPFYLQYKEEWIREVQLHDKSMIEYQAAPGSRVKLFYKVRKGKREELGYHTEVLMPVYENLYVKQFILYSDESVNYYFQEIRGKKSRTTDKQILDNKKSAVGAGKYGKLNDMACLGPAARHLAMLEYEEEERLAEQFFQTY